MAQQAKAPRDDNATAVRSPKLALDYVALSSGRDIAVIRENCTRHLIPEMKTKTERKWGKGSFPSSAEYCSAAIGRAIDTKEVSYLYLNLALQEQGRGEFTFAEDKDRVGDAPGRIMKSMLAAAEAGQANYAGADGKMRPLTAPQSFDIGATFGALRPDLVSQVEMAPALAAKATDACFDPKAKAATLQPGAPPQPIQQVCVALGKQLGRRIALAPKSVSEAAPPTAPASPVAASPAIAEAARPEAGLAR